MRGHAVTFTWGLLALLLGQLFQWVVKPHYEHLMASFASTLPALTELVLTSWAVAAASALPLALSVGGALAGAKKDQGVLVAIGVLYMVALGAVLAFALLLPFRLL